MDKIINSLFRKTFNVDIQTIEPISAHGSSRKYYRIKSNNIVCLAAINDNIKENIAFLDYANQLIAKGINVPKIYSQDIDNNIYLLEDLGDISLYDMVLKYQKKEITIDALIQMYKKVIKVMPKLQIQVGKDFDYTNAYPRDTFDRKSIFWDMNYFKYYFLKLSEVSFDEQELEKDFETLADYLLSTDTNYFLFRDFQSRNIMIHKQEPYFIDFQGGRKGALHYDLASLLFDAKADLTPELRKELLYFYIDTLKEYICVDNFEEHFYAYVYIRIMQAMGTYGYRGYFERKEHFLKSIPYALKNIEWLEKNVKLPIELPTLKNIFKQMINSQKLKDISKQRLKVTIKSFSYKKGYPHDLSGNGGGFVFDCRALHNPGRYAEYKSLTGMDKSVAEFLEKEEEVKSFYSNASALVLQSIEVYLKREFTSLCVYFGCTGGQHRSVYMAQRLFDELSQRGDLEVNLQHVEQNR